MKSIRNYDDSADRVAAMSKIPGRPELPIAALYRGSESRLGSLARGRLATALTGTFDHLFLRRGRWNANPGRR